MKKLLSVTLMSSVLLAGCMATGEDLGADVYHAG